MEEMITNTMKIMMIMMRNDTRKEKWIFGSIGREFWESGFILVVFWCFIFVLRGYLRRKGGMG